MMSRLDFIKKQILFIESSNSKKLKFKNLNLVLVDEDNKIVLQHSCYRIFLVFIYGEFSITSVLIKNTKKFSFPIVFLNYNLKPYFSINCENKGNFLLRKKQYINHFDLDISKHIIKNKVLNQINLIKDLRYRTSKENMNLDKLKFLYSKINKVKDEKELLGIEGNSSKLFFTTYFKNLNFIGRKPRTKIDVFNLLFDIGYNYLFNFIEANLEIYGFDIYYGFYHKLFYQRKSLVCDIIEPFRCIVDKKIKNGFNLKQIDLNDFDIKNNQYYIKKGFQKKYSSLFLKAILNHKEEIFLYIQKYYRCFMKSEKIERFPIFEIIKK